MEDFFEFDPAGMLWRDLSGQVQGVAPMSRAAHGVASANGKVFIFGGYGGSGRRSV